MSAEAQIRTRHRQVESSSSKELMSEKSLQSHKDRGRLLKLLKENYFRELRLVAELCSERETVEILKRQLDYYYKEQGRSRRKVTPAEAPRLH